MQRAFDAKEAEALFNREYPPLYRYALYLSKDRETAQDLCQEAFIRFINLETPHQIEAPGAWLKKVLSNIAFNYFRRQKIVLKLDSKPNDCRMEGSVSMEQDLLRLEVEDVLSTLAWKDQVLLKMKMDGMSYKEIAEALDISIGSVGTMLARAMRKFKLQYEGKEDDGKNELSKPRQAFNVPGRSIGL